MHRSFILLLAGALLASCTAGKTPLHKQTEQFFPLPLNGAIRLENGGGSIRVYGWDEPRVRLAAVRNAYSEQRLQQIDVAATATADALSIRTVIPPASGVFADRSGTVDYTLNVPEQAQVTLHLRDGEILLQGMRGGRAAIKLGNGRVFLRNCFARVQAQAVHGAMDLLYEWWENAPALFDLTVAHGRIGALLPVGAKFKVDAATADGQVGNGFEIPVPDSPGPGHAMRGQNAPEAPVSFHLRLGDGNINIDSSR